LLEREPVADYQPTQWRTAPLRLGCLGALIKKLSPGNADRDMR